MARLPLFVLTLVCHIHIAKPAFGEYLPVILGEPACVSRDLLQEGAWSLSFEKVLQEDGGDYFCSVHKKHGARKWGAPAAVRLNVTRRRDQSSTSPPTRSPSQVSYHVLFWLYNQALE
ncbi:hypothetical protein KUCAC02_035719 [Chaenocephalus aceratus]|nr:hypothetical protein KUCAC02_035719 [Chaenocephalus aceratus]